MLSGAGDQSPLADAVEEAQASVLSSGRCAGVGFTADAISAVQAWETRRRGRCVRLWRVFLEVHGFAMDLDDARWRLAGFLHFPRHRVDEGTRLCSTGHPEIVVDHEKPPVVDEYPREALRHRDDRTSSGPCRRAHVAAYVRALQAARARALDPLPRCPDPGPEDIGAADPQVRLWRVRHVVLFLAGPGEAPTRAAEIAATIVNHRGSSLARVSGLEPEDGTPDGLGGRIHPACSLTSSQTTALWNDYDAAEGDTGDPEALAQLLSQVAARLQGVVHNGEERSALGRANG